MKRARPDSSSSIDDDTEDDDLAMLKARARAIFGPFPARPSPHPTFFVCMHYSGKWGFLACVYI